MSPDEFKLEPDEPPKARAPWEPFYCTSCAATYSDKCRKCGRRHCGNRSGGCEFSQCECEAMQKDQAGGV